MGNSLFIPSGKCDRYKSTPECRNKTRYLYINNVPQEIIPCADTTIPSDPICKQNNPTGLIPGVIQDIVNINHKHSVNEMIKLGREIERNVLFKAVKAHLDHKVVISKNKTIVFN